jgi:hypothetical protein
MDIQARESLKETHSFPIMEEYLRDLSRTEECHTIADKIGRGLLQKKSVLLCGIEGDKIHVCVCICVEMRTGGQ